MGDASTTRCEDQPSGTCTVAEATGWEIGFIHGQELPPLFGQCSTTLFFVFMWFVLTETKHSKIMRTGFWPLYRLAWFCSFFLCSNSPVYLLQFQCVEILSSPSFIPVLALVGFISMEQISSYVTKSEYIEQPERLHLDTLSFQT